MRKTGRRSASPSVGAPFHGRGACGRPTAPRPPCRPVHARGSVGSRIDAAPIGRCPRRVDDAPPSGLRQDDAVGPQAVDPPMTSSGLRGGAWGRCTTRSDRAAGPFVLGPSTALLPRASVRDALKRPESTGGGFV